jgi:hypothetical protein
MLEVRHRDSALWFTPIANDACDYETESDQTENGKKDF